jgi:hypothetical protein
VHGRTFIRSVDLCFCPFFLFNKIWQLLFSGNRNGARTTAKRLPTRSEATPLKSTTRSCVLFFSFEGMLLLLLMCTCMYLCVSEFLRLRIVGSTSGSSSTTLRKKPLSPWSPFQTCSPPIKSFASHCATEKKTAKPPRPPPSRSPAPQSCAACPCTVSEAQSRCGAAAVPQQRE